MVQIFVSALLALTMAISSAVAGTTPASHETNPSETAKKAAKQVSEFVKDNNPSTFQPQDNKPQHPEHPNTPKNGDQGEEDSINPLLAGPVLDGTRFQIDGPTPFLGGESQTPNVETPTINANADFGQGIAEQVPAAATTDGKSFGTSVSGSVRH